MDRTHKLRYSDFFAQLQSAQDLLAERLGICLVLVSSDGRELTLPSGLPLVCYEHEHPRFGCSECHARLIAKVAPSGDCVPGLCPYQLYLAALETSIRTEDGRLFLLAGRTADPSATADQVDLLKAIYTLPFETPAQSKRAAAPAQVQPSAQPVLTAQENKVLACVVAGLPNKDIASHLCISQSTVKAHVGSILKKLNLSNRTEASVYALRNGITLDDEHV